MVERYGIRTKDRWYYVQRENDKRYYIYFGDTPAKINTLIKDSALINPKENDIEKFVGHVMDYTYLGKNFRSHPVVEVMVFESKSINYL